MAKKVDVNRLYMQAQALANGLEKHGGELQAKGEAPERMLNIKDLVANLRCAPQSVHWANAPLLAKPRPQARLATVKAKRGKRA